MLKQEQDMNAKIAALIATPGGIRQYLADNPEKLFFPYDGGTCPFGAYLSHETDSFLTCAYDEVIGGHRPGVPVPEWAQKAQRWWFDEVHHSPFTPITGTKALEVLNNMLEGREVE